MEIIAIVAAFVREFGVIIGRDEEGRDIEGIRWEVVAEAADGSRWVHEVGFLADELVWHDDDRFGPFCARQHDDQAVVKAQKLADAVKAKGVIELTHWQPTQAANGSVAYDDLEALEWEAEQELINP